MHLYYPRIPPIIVQKIIHYSRVNFASAILVHYIVKCHTSYVVSIIARKTIDDNIMSYCYTSNLGFKYNL